MELKVITIYLFIFLNGYSQGENAGTTAIRNKHKPEVKNKLVPHQVYAVSNGAPNFNPALSLRLNNGVKNVPRIVVPVATKQPNAICPNYPIVKVSTPSQSMKAESNAVSSQTISEEEKAKESMPEIKGTIPKETQFVEKVEQGTKTRTETLPKENKPQTNEQKTKEAVKTESNQPISNEKTPGQEEPPVNKDEKIDPPKVIKIETSPKTESKTDEKEKQETNGRQNNDSEVDVKSSRSGGKDYTFTIYKLDDDENKHPRVFNNQPNVYMDNIDYVNNQATSNVIIKNHDIEEMCERGQDIISPYQPDPYNDQYNIQQPDIYQTYSNYHQMPLDYVTPNYQYQSEGNFNINSGMERPNNPKDRVWRNWKSTEIYISKYDPMENKFNNGYFRSNGFSTPFMNGGVIGSDYRNPNTPYFYQCYLHPTYKQMY